MDASMSDRGPAETQVALKLAGARAQIALLREHRADPVIAESCAGAAISQMLQAILAALAEMNRQLPDPLPLSRLTRRNLRDHFYAVEVESRVVREIEVAAQAGRGWLWWLEQKQLGGSIRPLLTEGQGAIWRKPLDHHAGVEPGDPVTYLSGEVARVEQLIGRVRELAVTDLERFRVAAKRPARRLLE